jgi:flagellin-specific chaperone FliS
LIAPSAAIGGRPELKKSDYNSIKVLPLRFVEVAEMMDENIQNFLRKKHLQGCKRIHNLSNIDRVHEFLKNLRESLDRNNRDDFLKRLFRCYLICGGTAHGIKCVDDCLNNRELEGFSHMFLKTVEEILEDARAYGRYYGGINYVLFQVALQAAMMYFAEKVMKEGLETNQVSLLGEIINKAQEISLWWNIGQRHEDLRNAVFNAIRYLDDSGIVIGIKRYKEQNVVKYVFTDPRYLIGAYLYYTHMVGNNEYPNEYPREFGEVLRAINDLVPIEPEQQVQEKPKTKDLSAKLGHYLEAITLSNLALGAYAMSVSCGGPEKDRPPLSKYINYIKTNDYEIDAFIKVGCTDEKCGKVNLGILFEVSRSFDKQHVDRCKKALDGISKTLKDGNGLYCIYATLDGDKVYLRDDKVIVAPLPLALLLF